MFVKENPDRKKNPLLGSDYFQVAFFVIRRESEKYYIKMTNQWQDIIEKHGKRQLPLLKYEKLFIVLLCNIPEEQKL